MADIVKLIYKGDEMAQWGWWSSTPIATDSVIWSVRLATTQEFNNRDNTWSQWETLVLNINQISNLIDSNQLSLYSQAVTWVRDTATWEDVRASVTYTPPKDGFVIVEWTEHIVNGNAQNYLENEDDTYSFVISDNSGFSSFKINVSGTDYKLTWDVKHQVVFAVTWSQKTFSVYNTYNTTSTIEVKKFFTFIN